VVTVLADQGLFQPSDYLVESKLKIYRELPSLLERHITRMSSEDVHMPPGRTQALDTTEKLRCHSVVLKRENGAFYQQKKLSPPPLPPSPIGEEWGRHTHFVEYVGATGSENDVAQFGHQPIREFAPDDIGKYIETRASQRPLCDVEDGPAFSRYKVEDLVVQPYERVISWRKGFDRVEWQGALLGGKGEWLTERSAEEGGGGRGRRWRARRQGRKWRGRQTRRKGRRKRVAIDGLI
jgi:hypothetical protein